MENVIVFAMNVAIVAILTVAFVVFKWSGPGFAFGAIVGAWFFFVYFRIKYGRWP